MMKDYLLIYTTDDGRIEKLPVLSNVELNDRLDIGMMNQLVENNEPTPCSILTFIYLEDRELEE